MKTTRKRKLKQKGGNNGPCIYIDLSTGEGLGNQLFSYAKGLAEQEKVGLPLCIIKAISNPHSNRNYRNMFNAKKVNARNNSSKYKSKNVVIPNKNYQNYQDIKHVIPKIKSILLKNEFNKDKYKEYISLIDCSKTAFMHVRRGDKISRNQQLETNYFREGLAKLNNNNNIKIIYIFSDDIEWCKSHDSLWKSSVTNKTIKYFDNSDELIVLYMMLLCEAGALLSNSTFGMWGAMLGADSNPNSTIVYNSKPKDYPGQTNPIKFPERWIGL